MRCRNLLVLALLPAFALAVFAGPLRAMSPHGVLGRAAAAKRAIPPIDAETPERAPDVVTDAAAAMISEQVAKAGATQAFALQAVDIRREVIAGDVAHYTISVRTGAGRYDRIRVHRVVRESRPGVPIRAERNFFFQHGDLKDFVGMMLPGLYEPSLPRSFGVATFMARNNVDVWGIDQDWTLVPESETDLSFMSTWGLGRAVRNLELGIAVARSLRLATGSGGGPMLLGGYSSGGFTAAALLDRESQLPALLRQVSGYINIDIPVKPGAQPGIVAALLGDLALQNGLIASGQYGSFQPFKLIAELAMSAPDDPSPIFEGFTNYQVAAYITIAPGGTGWPAPIHYWGGDFDETGFPTGPRLTTKSAWLEFLQATIVWQPARFFKEYDEFALEPQDGLSSPFNDHLADVQVPMLNVVPGGGVSCLTPDGLAPYGSLDKQVVSPTTGSPAETDIGHVDLFTWEGSEALVWRPMLNWIATHSKIRRDRISEIDLANAPAFDEDGGPVVSDALFGIRRITPNPVSGPFGVEFSLPATSPASLEVLDVAGRVVETQAVGAGARVPQSARLGTSARLMPGIYVVRLSQAGRQWSQRVAVVR